ncbi:MAG: lipoyl(octanoyl) transferase LipB [Actinobacteria bacterium]|nr:lipoyl(octanoyl) transferase LipB [Actinomycetota bacterium]
MRASDAPILAVHAALVPYGVAWDWQRDLVTRRAADEIGDVLLTLEHPRVYTAGKRAHSEHVLWGEAERNARGIELFEVDRGGDVTYHGPGQLVAYPILKLDDSRRVVDYVRLLEEACIRVIASHGIVAGRDPEHRGVWVGDDKIVAVGVRVNAGGVTSHGLAMNVTTDLTDFGGIVPCGIGDRGVCSLASLGIATTVDATFERLRRAFAELFGCSIEVTTTNALELAVPAAT